MKNYIKNNLKILKKKRLNSKFNIMKKSEISG